MKNADPKKLRGSRINGLRGAGREEMHLMHSCRSVIHIWKGMLDTDYPTLPQASIPRRPRRRQQSRNRIHGIIRQDVPAGPGDANNLFVRVRARRLRSVHDERAGLGEVRGLEDATEERVDLQFRAES